MVSFNILNTLQFQIVNFEHSKPDAKDDIKNDENEQIKQVTQYKDCSEQLIKADELISDIIKSEILKPCKNNMLQTRIQYINNGQYSIYELDNQGRDLRRLDYDASGEVLGELEFIYNEDGTQKHISKNSRGIIIQITDIDENDKVVHNKWFDDYGKLISIAENIYNGDEEKIITKDPFGRIQDIYVFDRVTNRRIANEHYNEDGTLRSYVKYEYFEDGSSIETEYNNENKVISIVKRDKNTELISSLYFGGSEILIEEINYKKEQSVLLDNLKIEKNKTNKEALFFFNRLGDIHNQVLKTRNSKNRKKINNSRYLENINKFHKNYVLALENKNERFNKIEKICKRILSLPVPMFPNESNYNNEKDYYRALEEYQYELYEYELKVNNLEVEIQNLYHDIAHDTQDMVLLNNLLDKLSKEFYEELF